MKKAMKGSHHIVSIFLATSLLHGCLQLPVTTSDIDWQESSLSARDCPNLTGKYTTGESIYFHSTTPSGVQRKRIGLYALMTGGERRTIDGVHITKNLEISRSQQDNQEKVRYISSIQFNGDAMSVSLINDLGIPYLTGTMIINSTNIGCHSGKFIIRTVINVGSPESGRRSVQYAETIISKVENGLIATQTSATRMRNRFTGEATGPELDVQYNSWFFHAI